MILDPIDQSVRDKGFNFVPFDRYLASPFQVSTDPTNLSGIASLQQPFIKPYIGGGGYFERGPLGPDDPLLNQENFYNLTSDKYFKNQDTPYIDDLRQSKLDKTFMGMPSYREQDLSAADLGEYIASGTDIPLELTGAGKTQQYMGNLGKGISGLAETISGFGPVSFLMNKADKFDSLPYADQEFIKLNMGYTGPTVFGGDQSGLSRDPFGINTRSAFGNYAERVGKEYDKMTDVLSPTGKVGSKFSGATYNPATGLFESDTLSPEELSRINKRTNLLRKKQVFYRKQTEQRDRDRRIDRANRERAQRREAEMKGQTYTGGANLENIINQNTGERDATGGDPGSAGASDQFSNRSGRGRTGYLNGGIVDMLDIYD